MTYAFDPELAEFAALTVNPPPTDAVAARELSQQYLSVLGADVDTSTLDVDDRSIPGPDGAPDVVVRVYAPTSRAAAVPAIVYIHGGGFFVGSIDSEHAGAAALARELGVVVVSVEYRLAPEHPFPAGLEDCYAALTWVHEQADELGVDTDRVAINGGSAGGGLAAGLALLARDRGGPRICFQYLGIPELDDRLDTPSMRQFHDTPMWSRPAAEKSWEWYLGDAARPRRRVALRGAGPRHRPRRAAARVRVDHGVRSRSATRASATRWTCWRPACPSSCTPSRARSTVRRSWPARPSIGAKPRSG